MKMSDVEIELWRETFRQALIQKTDADFAIATANAAVEAFRKFQGQPTA